MKNKIFKANQFSHFLSKRLHKKKKKSNKSPKKNKKAKGARKCMQNNPCLMNDDKKKKKGKTTKISCLKNRDKDNVMKIQSTDDRKIKIN